MPKIGFHASAAGGVDKSVERVKKLSADTFQVFLNSPRVWAYPKLSDKQINEFRSKINQYNYSDITVHLAYLPNLATYEQEKKEKSFQVIKEAIKRCDILGISNLVIHIGSHRDKGVDAGIENVIKILDQSIELEPNVKLLLETSSGSPKLVGNKFEELEMIINGVSDESKIGVCFDTCHVFAAGYDLAKNTSEVMDEFENILGLNKIRVMHCNDSKGELGSRRDRHEHIGLGHIGLEAFSYLLNHKKMKRVPFIIETPNNEIRDDIANMNVLRGLIK